jgi:hypothetical protein
MLVLPGDTVVIYKKGRHNLTHICKEICEIFDARFEAFTAVIFQLEVFWVVTPCSVVVGYQRFGGPC